MPEQVGARNAYDCQKCGARVITVIRDMGVTPMKIDCHEERCIGLMQSRFYMRVPDEPATHEWYSPRGRERAALTGYARDHVERDGLFLREIGGDDPDG